MKIKKIVFRINPAGKMKCSYCDKPIENKGIYLLIKYESFEHLFNMARLCYDCYNKVKEDEEEFLEVSQEIYAKAIKKRIIRRLK